MGFDIVSLKELYHFLLPAIKVKLRVLKYFRYNYISSYDIWCYLKESNWKKRQNLTIAEMVDDIINCDNVLLAKYISK